MASFVWNATKAFSFQLIWYYCLFIPVISEVIFNGISQNKKFMSTQSKQHYKRQEQNNTEWLDELINKIENMKNKISNT